MKSGEKKDVHTINMLAYHEAVVFLKQACKEAKILIPIELVNSLKKKNDEIFVPLFEDAELREISELKIFFRQKYIEKVKDEDIYSFVDKLKEMPEIEVKRWYDAHAGNTFYSIKEFLNKIREFRKIPAPPKEKGPWGYEHFRHLK